MLEINDLSIGYKGQSIVSSISASTEVGNIVVIAGRNGSGKSTLVRTLCGLLPPLSGKVEINGNDITRVSPRKRAAAVSMVLAKSIETTALKVSEVIALGKWPEHLSETDRQVESLLESFDLAHLRHRRLDEISDGERQKTMIARALIQDTPVIVMDEPTAFLDLPTRIEWWNTLTRLKEKGKLVIVTTHDLHHAKADQYWVLRKSPPAFISETSVTGVEALLKLIG